MFAIEAQDRRKYTVLRLTGSVLVDNVLEFNRQLESYLLAPKVREVALDLSRIDRMDNAGIGALVSSSTKGRARGCRLVLLAPAPHVTKLMKDIGIEEFFPMYENEDEMRGHYNLMA
jgi:anti-sigma B factor antagonist